MLYQVLFLNEKAEVKTSAISLVLEAGLEPARTNVHWIFRFNLEKPKISIVVLPKVQCSNSINYTGKLLNSLELLNNSSIRFSVLKKP